MFIIFLSLIFATCSFVRLCFFNEIPREMEIILTRSYCLYRENIMHNTFFLSMHRWKQTNKKEARNSTWNKWFAKTPAANTCYTGARKQKQQLLLFYAKKKKNKSHVDGNFSIYKIIVSIQINVPPGLFMQTWNKVIVPLRKLIEK